MKVIFKRMNVNSGIFGNLKNCLKIEFLVKINKQINGIVIIITKIILKWMNVNSWIFEIEN